jgi:hypothetical protein
MTLARRAAAGLAASGLLFGLAAWPASAQTTGRVTAHVMAFPGLDCKESPTPDMPGQGLAEFFDKAPDPLPKQEDPFAKDARTTVYQQYGYSGLRWHTYDLGCGPDAARNPDAVVGTAVSNWLLNIPISMSALTASVTQVAFRPTFLHVFDAPVTQVSRSLHRSLFATWVPAVLALLGVAILLKARRAALATTAAAVGWALIVILLATAVFRWPLAAGGFADRAVASTLGSVVGGIGGVGGGAARVSPSVAVASNVQESILYHSWLAGTLGSTDSVTAERYGARLFEAQALTWHEAYVVQHDPVRGKQIIEQKSDDWEQVAARIQASDPTAYEYLTGKRSDTRVGYALLSTVAAVLALPFLLVAALLVLGSFLIVRLAVMLFPAFATLGVLPAGRGLVIGIGRTVGAALVNSVIFGIGAAVTIRVLGLLLDPHSGLPGWLALVLMPLFSFVMWVGLKPFRRLTTMVSPRSEPFADLAGSVGGASRGGGRFLKKALATGVGVYTGNVAAAATVAGRPQDDLGPPGAAATERAEARPTYEPHVPAATWPGPSPALDPGAGQSAPAWFPPQQGLPRRGRAPLTQDDGLELPDPSTVEDGPPEPIEAEWVDGEEVYAVYRPPGEGSDAA